METRAGGGTKAFWGALAQCRARHGGCEGWGGGGCASLQRGPGGSSHGHPEPLGLRFRVGGDDLPWVLQSPGWQRSDSAGDLGGDCMGYGGS